MMAELQKRTTPLLHPVTLLVVFLAALLVALTLKNGSMQRELRELASRLEEVGAREGELEGRIGNISTEVAHVKMMQFDIGN